MTAAVVLLTIGCVALVALWLADRIKLTEKLIRLEEELDQLRQEERQRIARRRRLALPHQDHD